MKLALERPWSDRLIDRRMPRVALFTGGFTDASEMPNLFEIEAELADLEVLFQASSLVVPGLLPGTPLVFRQLKNPLNLVLSQ